MIKQTVGIFESISSSVGIVGDAPESFRETRSILYQTVTRLDH